MDIRSRNNVTVTGRMDGRVLLLAHGFGCDQNMWRLVLPALAAEYRVVLFDYVGSGRADASAWDERRYSSLEGYARDVLEVCEELDLRDVTFVGHSVSAMVGVLAAAKAPQRFSHLVMVAPSPCYIDDDGYRGGFSADDIDELLESLESNYLGWSAAMAPVIMGNADRPELGEELKVEVNLASGGHPSTLIQRADGSAHYLPTPGGMLIGVLPKVQFTAARTQLYPGDTLLVYTDGLTEARTGPERELYGDDALRTFAAGRPPAGPQALVSALRGLINGFGAGLDDDTALLAFGMPASPPLPLPRAKN
ncbi:alpha/beta fold hydrolase [Streptomyces sp. NPDC051597]|uniref:alpha/beta fold hydrolase n=1 Tax=Streptomyces sp. NPDC051597 TaxID=3155049 RepID=UPI0034340D92